MSKSKSDARAAERLYGQLISPIERRMMQTVHRIVRDPDLADDAFQEALARVWKNLAKAHRHPNPHGYILRICANAAYDVVRKQARLARREAPLVIEQAEHNGAPVPSPAGEHEQLRAVVDAITSLPRKQAQAVHLRFFEQQDFIDIARAIGCREATARSHVSKGMARLREILGEATRHDSKERKHE